MPACFLLCAPATPGPAGGYQSAGTRHLVGWTNFRAAEADVPNMMVAEEE
jgi:hypothetical protein